SDASSIEEWARASVLACVEQQIISGYPDGTFGPHGNATRAEVATILSRVNIE
ncbi:MAG: S-layer homology domain-containing protein, partial [Firmicutes bacterium]|nr:S-layer homology domain-containing protein [Bacillota bacterium]